MRTGRIKNLLSGDVIDVTATTNHQDSSYDKPVWVDKDGVAYMQCDLKVSNPFYEIIYDSYSERARIGTMIASVRNKRGYTVRELAEKSGVNYANVSKIERGVYNVSVDILRKLCDALEVEIVLKEKATE